jgi:hypothetical protein
VGQRKLVFYADVVPARLPEEEEEEEVVAWRYYYYCSL